MLLEKLGTILLVMMPSSELGPLIPRNARKSNNIFEALVSATMEESIKLVADAHAFERMVRWDKTD